MKDESDKRGLKYSKVTNSSFKQLPKSGEKFDTMERSTSKHLNLLCRTCSVNEDSIVERISIPYRTCRSLKLARFFRLDALLAIFSRIEIFKCELGFICDCKSESLLFLFCYSATNASTTRPRLFIAGDAPRTEKSS